MTDYKDNDLEALHKSLVRAFERIKNYGQGSLKKSNQESLKMQRNQSFPLNLEDFHQ